MRIPHLTVACTLIITGCSSQFATALDPAGSTECAFEMVATAGPPAISPRETESSRTVQHDGRVIAPSVAVSTPRVGEVAHPSALVPLQSATDHAHLDDLFADDYRFVDVAGRVQGRDRRLASPLTVGTGCDAEHRYGNIAVVIAHDGETRLLRVWVQRASHWRIVAEQAVMIQPGAPDPPAIAPPSTFRESPSLDSTPDAVVADVLRAQDALDRANAMRDPATFARLTHADFVVVTAQGLLRTKADRLVEERIALLERQPERPRPRRDDLRVRVFESVAIVTARNWPRTFEGAPRPPTRYTRVWIKGRAGWQQVANISTFATSD